jgi:hypothetical protein
MPKDYHAPSYPQQRSMVRRFKFKIPFLQLDPGANVKKTEGKDGLTLQELDESLVKQQFLIEHESYRKDQWEPLKHFRSKYDAEYPISESILSAADITSRKREMDKLTMNAIRLCILNDEHERVFSYMDLLHFSQSLKMCVQLCEQLNAFELS